MDAFWIFMVILVLFIMWVQGGGPARSKQEGLIVDSNSSNSSSYLPRSLSNQLRSRSTASSEAETSSGPESKYKGKIYLQSGTAASTIQPNQEYVIIGAQGNESPISLAGWSLKNGRGEQLYVVSGNTVKGQSTTVKIPSSGVAIFDPYHPASNRSVPITLKSGERAIITTGNPPVFSGVKINNNFKINRCLGYLEDEQGYQAYPRLTYNCPSSNDVPGITSLDNTCYDFVRSIRTCHTPKDIYVKDEGDCLDGNCKLSSYCRRFVQDNYNFATCFATYSRDKDFTGPEWRIFLGRNWELWLDRRESISLFDSSGLLVSQITY